MAHSIDSRATYADIEAAPRHVIAEIISGVLRTRRYFGPRDGMALTVLKHELCTSRLRDKKTCSTQLVLRPELYIGSNVLVPDLAVWPQEVLRHVNEWRDVTSQPDWVCDFITVATDHEVLWKRGEQFAQMGIQSMWQVDPRNKLLEVFARQGKDWLLTDTFQDNNEVSAPPFGGLTFKLGLLWPFDNPPADAAKPAS